MLVILLSPFQDRTTVASVLVSLSFGHPHFHLKEIEKLGLISLISVLLGFNCGEAANIATPEWLKVAKEAAIRRASMNYPPMVSHYQLLYELALSIISRYFLWGLRPNIPWGLFLLLALGYLVFLPL